MAKKKKEIELEETPIPVGSVEVLLDEFEKTLTDAKNFNFDEAVIKDKQHPNQPREAQKCQKQREYLELAIVKLNNVLVKVESYV